MEFSLPPGIDRLRKRFRDFAREELLPLDTTSSVAALLAMDRTTLTAALKGSVSSIGADRLTQFCTRISSMEDELLHAESQAVARALREEFETVKNALADYLAGRKRTAR